MVCSKCHAEIDDKTKYCSKCGKEVEETKRTTLKPIPKMEEIEILELEEEKPVEKKKEKKEIPHQEQYRHIQKQDTSDNEYIDAYIGFNVDWIKKQSFSILTAIFGPFYLLARKLWLLGFIMIVLFIFSYLYLSETVGIVFRVICDLLIATRFRSIYLKEAEKKVEQIKMQYPNKSNKELLERCKKKGGLFNVGLVITCFLIYVVIVGVLVSHKNFPERIKEAEPSNSKVIQGMNYSLSNDSILKAEYTNYHYYVNHLKEGTCYITISSFSSSKTPEQYMNDQIEYLVYDSKETADIKINDLPAKYLLVESKTNRQEIIYIKNESYMYEITFDSSNTKDNCKQDREIFIKNTNWKKEQ